MPARRSGSPPPLPSTPPAAGAAPLVVVTAAPASPLAEAIELVEARIARLTRSGRAEDKLSLARAHLELAALDEVNGDGSRVLGHAEASLRVEPSLAMGHVLLRRARHARNTARHLLEPLEREIVAASSEAQRADLLAEGSFAGRVGGSRRGCAPRGRRCCGRAEAPAALKGLEPRCPRPPRRRRRPGKLAEHRQARPAPTTDVRRVAARRAGADPRPPALRRDDAWGALKSALSADGVGQCAPRASGTRRGTRTSAPSSISS